MKYFQVLGLSADLCPFLCPQPLACDSSAFQVPLGCGEFLMQLRRGWPDCGDCTRRSPWITRSVRPSGTTLIPKATVERTLSGWTQTHHRTVCGFIHTALIWVISLSDLSWAQKMGAWNTPPKIISIIPLSHFLYLNLHNYISSDISSFNYLGYAEKHQTPFKFIYLFFLTYSFS